MAEVTNSSNKTNWLIFLVSLIVCLALLFLNPTWFWVPLPFVLTYLVAALDVM